MLPTVRRFALCLAALALIAVTLVPGDQQSVQAARSQATGVSYWGMNVYLTKRERLGTGDNLAALAASAKAAGIQWTREEITWDLVEPQNNQFKTFYDSGFKQAADNGFNIIGMLLTTPQWARDGACRNNYWCPPADVNEYAQFAAWMVERYDGDGNNDAPGSPRIAAWEIWNEPNAAATWPSIGSTDATRRRYGDMMVAAYNAIKAADPSAIVLTGGVYVYDGGYCDPNNCDGLRFLGGVFQQVPAAKRAFDVLSIHPYIPTERPDAPNIPRLITVEGRVRNSRAWLNGAARSDAPIWITEMGWCTAPGTCPGGVQVSEEQQANYLVRSMVIAQQTGVQHTSWFQFEDAFNNSGREWANAAIVRNYDGSGYPVKPAYHAYRTLATYLGTASPVGKGPAHTQNYDPNQPYAGGGGTYDFRYTRGGTIIDVLWRPTDSVQVAFPVTPGKQITLVQRDGQTSALQPVNGAVSVGLSEKPIMIVQADNPRLTTSPSSITFLAQRATGPVSTNILIGNASGTPLQWSATTSTPWLSLSATSGTTPGLLRVTANHAPLDVGTWTGSITISSSAGTITVPVTLKIVQAVDRGYIPLIGR